MCSRSVVDEDVSGRPTSAGEGDGPFSLMLPVGEVDWLETAEDWVDECECVPGICRERLDGPPCARGRLAGRVSLPASESDVGVGEEGESENAGGCAASWGREEILLRSSVDPAADADVDSGEG